MKIGNLVHFMIGGGERGLPSLIFPSTLAAGAAFTNFQFVTEVGPIADEGLIAGRWAFQGIFQGGIPGAAPEAIGKQIRYNGIDIFRVAEGKIVEYWLCADTMHMLQQIGVIPS